MFELLTKLAICVIRLFTQPIQFNRHQLYAPIAQLDRVTDFESGGRRFESCWARHIKSTSFGSVFLIELEFVAGFEP